MEIFFSAVRSPNIVKFFGCCLDPQISMVTEYCALGNLWTVLNDPSITLTSDQMHDIAIGLAKGVHYLHTFSPVVIHGGITSRNIMVSVKVFLSSYNNIKYLLLILFFVVD